MTETTQQRIALLPLDDRPVNVALPQDVARVAGWIVDTPPAGILPDYRAPGDIAALGAWLLERAEDPATAHLVVSLDMLCYGGLIASRTSQDSTTAVLERLELLRTIKRSRPDLPISAVSLVMRASNSYSAAEEPEYWSSYGKDLHELGGTVHRVDSMSDDAAPTALTEVPSEVVADYATRRIRNHILNLSSLTLVEDRTLDFLAITADDTATFSAGSAEQHWLRHWMRFLPTGNTILMYPGADEVGAVLVARAIAHSAGTQPTIRISCPDPEGLGRTPLFENVPLAESVARQVQASGARLVGDDSPSDVVLVLHAPDPLRHDMAGGYPDLDDPLAVEATARQVAAELAAGNRVALADVRYPNGADAGLVRALSESGALRELTAFGAWNTAGNALGGVVATSVAAVLGDHGREGSAPAIRQALLTRLLDDYAYQTVIRSEDGPALFADALPIADDATVAHIEQVVLERMRVILREELGETDWVLGSLRLPWRRRFEVGIALHPVTAGER